MVANEPDEVGEVWDSRLVSDVPQHCLILHCTERVARGKTGDIGCHGVRWGGALGKLKASV